MEAPKSKNAMEARYTITRRGSRTSNSHYCLCLLSSDKEYHIALRGVDIVVLQKERLVDTIFLECGELDEQIQWTSERFFENEILFSSYLCSGLSMGKVVQR